MGAKVHILKENNPDHQLRPRNTVQVNLTKCGSCDSQDVGLEAAIHLKSA